MGKTTDNGVAAIAASLYFRGLWPKRIVQKLTLLFSTLIVITLGLFVLVTMPYQRKAILEAMESEARSTVTSIDQVTASAIITEDFGTVVEHCLRVVKESPSISYVVVTRNDGFSLIITKTGWVQGTLRGVWVPAGERVAGSRFLKSEYSTSEVYHYSHPFQYSGIDWGWIHIGLSLNKFNSDISALYLRTGLLALLCLSVGIVVALYFARKLTRPISALADSTKQVALGDLTVRTDIRTGDELEHLGQSFNAMTERLQKTQREIMAAKEHAEAASRAKSQFLANMSHEIRTPMNGVLGMLDLLMDSRMDTAQLKLARMAHGSAEKLLEVINDILDFSKIEAGRLQLQSADFVLRGMVHEVMDMFWVRARNKNINLVCEIGESVPEAVRGDAVRLRQILINLIGNAVKFTDAGHVSLGLTLAGTTAEYAELRFEVADTGSGIPVDVQPFVFDAFSQADSSMARRHEGTGLGLAISKELVEAMEGAIGFRSEPDGGSLFWFTARLRHAQSVPDGISDDITAPENEDLPSCGYMPKVLLAEDNPVNQELGRLVLESLNCEVDVVENGREAVEAVFGKEYDLVFMDCQMPEVDGYEATRIIRRRESEFGKDARRVSIVALTAHAMDGDRELCLAAGMDDYAAKPFTPAQIQSKLNLWCAALQD